MNLVKNSVLIVLVVIAFSACKNDLKLNAPYKEIPTIYAVLNPSEKVQMVRVNKVFLSETDANEVAKIADSVNYQPGEISVSLTHSSKPGLIIFTDSVIKTQEGAFNTTQRVYVSYAPLETGGIYTLTVKNNNTGNVFTATTSAIAPIDPGKQLFVLFNGPFYPAPPTTDPSSPHLVDYSALNPKFPYVFRFSPNEGAIYKLTMRLHFYDSLYNDNIAGPERKLYKYVDYPGENIEKKEKTEILINFRGIDIFTNVGIALSKMGLSNDIAGRKMYKMEYIINSTTQDYIDYLQYAAPSLSINQNKPLYSNFKDAKALGIFTFRTTFTMSKSLSNVYVNTFASNPNTCYKFFRANLTLDCFK